MMEERRRLSLKLSDAQTSHLQAITGMPCEVPVPRNVIFKSKFFKYPVKIQNMSLIQCLTNSYREKFVAILTGNSGKITFAFSSIC
jgi:hypothetical protein